MGKSVGSWVVLCALSLAVIGALVACGAESVGGGEDLAPTSYSNMRGALEEVAVEEAEQESRFSREDVRDAVLSLGGNVGDFEGLIVKRNSNGYLRRIYGEGFSLPLPAAEGLRDGEDELGARARGLLTSLHPFVGAFAADISLEHVRTKVIKAGAAVIRYKQHFQGFEVLHSEVIVVLNPEGRVISFVSTAAPDMHVELGGASSVAEVFQGACTGCVEQAIDDRIDGEYSVTSWKNVLMLDEAGATGTPMMYIRVRTLGGESYAVVADPTNSSLQSFRCVTSRGDADQRIRTFKDHAFYSATPCPNGDSDCSFSYLCSPETDLNGGTDPGNVVNVCVSDCAKLNSCRGFGDWICDQKSGKCSDPDDGLPWSLLELYDNVDESGWIDPNRSYNLIFERIRSITEDLYQFHVNDLGRYAWDDNGGEYVTNISTPAASSGGDGVVDIRASPYYLTCYDGSLLQELNCYRVDIPHEWSHNVDESIVGDRPPKESCLGENFVFMNESLFSVSKIGLSNVQVSPQKGCRHSAWMDDTGGLSQYACGTGMYIPYALRSAFDWDECPPAVGNYQPIYTGTTCESSDECEPYYTCSGSECAFNGDTHNNGPIWRRFLRLLAEGSSTFSVDENGEDIGVSFSGIGLHNMVGNVFSGVMEVFSAAAEMRFVSMSLEDWVDSLITAGIAYGRSTEVKKSLGAIGFLSDTYTSSTMLTDRAPYRYYFSAWHYLYSKYFTVYRQRNSYDITVAYADWYGGQTITIPANTSDAPAVAEYNDRLYVFWRDRSSSAIKFKYIRYDGSQYGPYELGSKGVYTGGAFDVVEYQDSLYVVYSEASTLKTKIAKCNASWCSSSGWHDFDSGSGVDYTKYLGYYAHPGMGVAHGAGLDRYNVFEDLLYIVSAGVTYPDGRIRVDAMDYTDNRTHSWPVVEVDSNFPSSRTYSVIGAKMVRSAFPEYNMLLNPDRNYLYFSWKGLDGRIYKSVVQSYNRQDPGSTMITKSHDTFLSSSRGVRIMKGQGEEVDRVYYCTFDSLGRVRYSCLYGRY